MIALALDHAALALAWVLAAINYLAGLAVVSSSFTSGDMKQRGRRLMEYGILIGLFLALAGPVLSLADVVYSQLGGGLTLADTAESYRGIFESSLVALGGITGLSVGVSFIPVVGATVGMVLAIAFLPFTLILAFVVSTSLSLWGILAIFSALADTMLAVGCVLMAAPLGLGQRLGGLLTAAAIVLAAVGPALPAMASSMATVALDYDPAEWLKDALEGALGPLGVGLGAFTNAMSMLYHVFMMMIATSILVVFLAAGIEGVSRAMGGAAHMVVSV